MRAHRRLLGAAVILVGGCATTFESSLTPSGVPCTDMPIIPAGQVVEQAYHRMAPVASAPRAGTEAERLWSLRKTACLLRADAVIEATNEETRAADGQGYVTRASGTAVLWKRGPAKLSPITVTPMTSSPGPVPLHAPAPVVAAPAVAAPSEKDAPPPAEASAPAAKKH